MKYIKFIGAALLAGSLASCQLDEVYKSEMDMDMVYSTKEGFDGLINSCYENIYYLYGKEDGLAMLEAGDLWQNGSVTSANWKECINNYEWNTEVGPNKTLWNALYSIVAYCNTAEFYSHQCKGYKPEEIKPKLAEAYFMRAFAYYHIVEQWGGVSLTTTSMAAEGNRTSAYRSSEEKIYNVIINDLDSAFKYLPVKTGERGRVTKVTAAAMLCKAWSQRSRLERDFNYNGNRTSDNNDRDNYWASIIREDGDKCFTAQECYANALKYGEWVISHAQEGGYGLFESTATESGSTQCWDGKNNKNNKEFLFVEAIDHVNGYNPEGWNRGRSRQYFMMSFDSDLRDYTGLGDQSIRYGRCNTNRVGPSLWLLHDCFDPRPLDTEESTLQKSYTNYCQGGTTVDTRFSDSFYYKYFTSSDADLLIPYDLWKRYGKDSLDYKKNVATNPAKFTINGTAVSKSQVSTTLGDDNANYYGSASPVSASQNFEQEPVKGSTGAAARKGLCLFTPNWPLDSAWCATKVYLCGGTPYMPDDMPVAAGKILANGNFKYYDLNYYKSSNSLYKSFSPSIKKLSPMYYIYDAQYSLNDFPIIRLTDIYLLAAEAAHMTGDQNKFMQYLKDVRVHAATSGNATAINENLEADINKEALNANNVNVSKEIMYLAKERARELVGECWRWYDLKRMGLLSTQYLNNVSKQVYQQTYRKMWYVRPIPQQFLDQIANKQEFGDNGYK